MPVTLSITTGDGWSNPYLALDIVLPDTLASLTVAGQVKAANNGANNVYAIQPVSGTVTEITPTGSGTQYLLIQVNPQTGAVSGKTSSSAMPTPDAGYISVAQQTVPSSVALNTVPSAQGGWALQNQW